MSMSDYVYPLFSILILFLMLISGIFIFFIIRYVLKPGSLSRNIFLFYSGVYPRSTSSSVDSAPSSSLLFGADVGDSCDPTLRTKS